MTTNKTARNLLDVAIILSALWVTRMFTGFVGNEELLFLALIVWYAWRWPEQECVLANSNCGVFTGQEKRKD